MIAIAEVCFLKSRRWPNGADIPSRIWKPVIQTSKHFQPRNAGRSIQLDGPLVAAMIYRFRGLKFLQ
jgi:hypothetical protein